MNKLKFSVTVTVLLMLVPVSAFSFRTVDEYLLRDKDAGCMSQECHSQFITGERAFMHEPAAAGKCGECHASAYPDDDAPESVQDITCSKCHKKIEHEIQTSRFIHGPVKDGECTSCHDPHGSDWKYLLKGPYDKLCSLCHNLKGLYRGASIHKPVKDGNCGLCHDVHASNYRSRLTDTGANLCLSCHEDMVQGMTGDHVHEPLLKTGCTDCHDPHSGEDSLRLKAASEKLCFKCHEEKLNEISQYTNKHDPASGGKCIVCHSPHYSESAYLLRDKVDTLCYNCHKENAVWKKRRFRHGPVVQGNCSACHNPHGSDNAFILRLSFPHKFYSAYKKGEYDLCFNCHKEALVTAERTGTATNFRNGEINLHRLHVYQEKGRTCRACHNIHASDQYDHLREEFLFGSVNIPIYYFKTKTGGRCIPGCHKERAYDRVDMVENKN